MSLRVQIGDKVVYEGESIPVPAIGEVIRRDGELLPIESVVWDLSEDGATVTLVVGSRPYTY